MIDTNFFEDFVDKSDRPTSMESILYLFWEKGISYNEFKNLPIPYIMGIIKTHNWVKREEERAIQKANKGKR